VNDELLFRILTGRADPAERASVRAWRSRSRENEQQYQELARILSLTSLADEETTASAPPVLTEVLGRGVPHGSIRSLPVPRRWAPRGAPAARKVSMALAAAAVLVLMAGVSRLFLEEASRPYSGIGADVHEFVTGPHETANVVLGDGTVIRLGSNSRLRIPNHSTGREVSISGRAYFAVAKDETRPFTVRTPEGEVRVLGTRFALEAVGEDLRLVVIEGRVGLSAPRGEVELEAKQVARVIRGNSLPIITVPDPTGVADWVGDFLAFQDTPLADVIDEISRKYDVRIELSEPSLARRTVTAWFGGYTLEQVMEVVCMVANAECVVGDSVVTMQPQV
jgi:transmembrane sensor